MVRTGWLAALIVVLAPWPSPAQFGGMGGMGGGMGGMMGRGGIRAQPPVPEDWTATFESFNGQSVTGKIQLSSIEIACSLGLYEVKPGKVKSIQFNPAPQALVSGPNGTPREGTLVSDSGESVVGKINVPSWWKLETELGTLTPDPQQLKTITFVARSEVSPASKPGEQQVKPGSQQDKPGDQQKKPQTGSKAGDQQSKAGDQQGKSGEVEKKS